MPDGGLQDTAMLVSALNLSLASIDKRLPHPLLSKFKIVRPGKQTLWGNPKTVTEYNKQTTHETNNH
jgi:hypothetical protein